MPGTTALSTLSLHDALPIFALGVEVVRSRLRRAASRRHGERRDRDGRLGEVAIGRREHAASLDGREIVRSEEHTSELQSRLHLVCRLLLEKKKKSQRTHHTY